MLHIFSENEELESPVILNLGLYVHQIAIQVDKERKIWDFWKDTDCSKGER